ncbi:Carbohydrate-binding domain, family 9 [Plasmopara halstedii]|uniref:Carbohydrate-binding domain, family 9 n=1 Tax=Plasmopara halstedii TaxID=4781 RepID=A0A0P1A4J8_PLAHL|nr:Carbohydrate-binding domain, family 9 [Plasmopara halstedii]CEG35250.1 Carbohydrate-binding domain, family 9 [Plasmopara halstedii]|eukprot:XP_024571619.1 Carbohydrate-binding domain, family 9 [Plasmopara halstedii]
MVHLKLVAVLSLNWILINAAEESLHQSSASVECNFAHLHPQRYAAYHISPSTLSSLSIDGILDDEGWTEVPWSEPFQDIHDNDFEVFDDADGSTHNYKEFEINSRNTTWNLWLNRPYRDDGHENSTRVDPHYGFDMLNDAERLHYWSVEVALPLKALASYSSAKVPPKPFSFWRINFSRVEWPVRVVTDVNTGNQYYTKIAGLSEENWTWSSQYAVNMHRPEWWGYLQFRPPGELPPKYDDDQQHTEKVPLDSEWNIRYVSFQLYYAQHAYRDALGMYASSLKEYFASQEAFGCINLFHLSSSDESFMAQIGLRTNQKDARSFEFVSSIKDDGYIVVMKTDPGTFGI